MSQATNILNALRYGSRTTIELMRYACQYNARIFDLRDAGIEISAIPKSYNGKRYAKYRLITPSYKIDFDKAKLKPAFASKN